MLGFPLSSSPSLPWAKQQLSRQITDALSLLDFVDLADYIPHLRLLTFLFSTLWMGGILGSAVWVGRAFVKDDFSRLWAVVVSGLVFLPGIGGSSGGCVAMAACV